MVKLKTRKIITAKQLMDKAKYKEIEKIEGYANTYKLIDHDDNIIYKYYDVDIVKIVKSSGHIILNSGGIRNNQTKERINLFISDTDFHIYSSSLWFVKNMFEPNKIALFRDGIVISKNKIISECEHTYNSGCEFINIVDMITSYAFKCIEFLTSEKDIIDLNVPKNENGEFSSEEIMKLIIDNKPSLSILKEALKYISVSTNYDYSLNTDKIYGIGSSEFAEIKNALIMYIKIRLGFAI